MDKSTLFTIVCMACYAIGIFFGKYLFSNDSIYKKEITDLKYKNAKLSIKLKNIEKAIKEG